MIKDFIERNQESILEDLRVLVSHNSVLADDAEPFGQENRLVLDEALNMMEREGLKTTNLDYYCGYGECGEGDKLIGILAHLDIVPAGEGWDSDPFTMTQKDGFVYGRGVSDDKGAVIASLYAIKYLLESGYKFKKRLRLITGCNEETGSRCIKHYVEKEGHIDMGFTPDGSFPGIYAESGAVGGIIRATNSKIINISGGEATNVVCKRVNVELPVNSYDESTFNEFMRDNNIDYNIIKSNESIRLTVNGKAAHASTPDEGINAISYLMEGLYEAGFKDELVSYYHDKIGLTTHGEKFKANLLNDEHTIFTLNIGKVYKESNEICFTVDVRFPVTHTFEEVTDLMVKSLNLGNNRFEVVSGHKPLFFDTSTPWLSALLKAYQDVTHDMDSKMVAIGGGTYAKAINNCIAFGCGFEDDDNHMHDANERLEIAKLHKQIEIFVEAIKNLNEA